MRLHRFVPALAVVLSSVLLAPAADDPRAAFEAWRADRGKRIASENGWLTLVGLHWLKPGENRFGSAKDLPIVLDAPGVPADAGSLFLENGAVRLVPRAHEGFTVNGKPAQAALLHADTDENPDVLALGRLKITLIRRGDRLGLRVKDPESPTRKEFKGLEYFPFDPALRIVARYVPFPEPHKVKIPTAIGTEETMTAPGEVTFTLAGHTVSLVGFQEDPKDPSLFIVFSDGTSGIETYGAGRFLYTDPPAGGSVVLDFNRAYNPPCAFTPFATCPLPPRENRLAVRIAAGEKAYAGRH